MSQRLPPKVYQAQKRRGTNPLRKEGPTQKITSQPGHQEFGKKASPKLVKEWNGPTTFLKKGGLNYQ